MCACIRSLSNRNGQNNRGLSTKYPQIKDMDYYDEVVEIKSKPKAAQPSDTESAINTSMDVENAMKKEVKEEDRTTHVRPTSSLPRGSARRPERLTSESESSDTETEDKSKYATEGFDYKQWESLNVPPEIKELYQYISRYSPPKIEISYTLQPFIPEFIPAVGDIDAFLKVSAPKPFNEKTKVDEFIEKLGLEILDEPCGEQSEPALLHMKLRSISTTNPRTPGPPPSISKSSKDIEKWISEVQAIHANQPYPMVTHSRQMPDIDALMTEWPTKMEQMLNSVGFPSANLNCSLKFYIELMCGIFDIPLPPTNNQVDYLFALNTLFNLYLAIKNPNE